ncbi:hypothetical protein PIB30_012702 [Stylosanthes scabra]|uniref:F-box/LRR-repeat protein 15-like leucin rich repeat domain-containing protein n=1 Tax=Stylosanthes scabra TaxID=79078 RepID=A0ABU6Q770_9FABA|nr:hypothetical protein [Stylosanthes scabra]
MASASTMSSCLSCQDVWGIVLSYLNSNDHESLSLTSREFLSTTNNLFFGCVTISDESFLFLSTLLHRFPNLTSIKLTPSISFPDPDGLNILLTTIASSHLPHLHSLDLSRQPQHGLSGFHGKFLTLKSLNCSHMPEFSRKDLLLIPQAFPNLSSTRLSLSDLAEGLCENSSLKSLTIAIQEKDFTVHLAEFLSTFKRLAYLSLTVSGSSDDFLDAIGNAVGNASLPLRRLVISNDKYWFSDSAIRNLLGKCNVLQQFDLQQVHYFVDRHADRLLQNLAGLTSLKLRSTYFTETAFFEILRNCPVITEINLEDAWLGFSINRVDRMNLPVNYNVKVLSFPRNSFLEDKTLLIIVSACPNLEELYLSRCYRISGTAVVEILKSYNRITHLGLANCCLSRFQLDSFNFEAPTLLELNLSGSDISDEALSAITRIACKVKNLNLSSCKEITEKGVMEAVLNCKHLRVINLKSCEKVAADVVDWMVVERPTLRKIVAPPQFDLGKNINFGHVVSNLY